MGGIGSAVGRSCQGDTRLQGSDCSCHHDPDGVHDGVRFHPCSTGYGGYHCRPLDGAHWLFPQRGGCLQDHQLGKYRAYCSHDADVYGLGKDRCIGIHFEYIGKRFGCFWPICLDGRYLLHYFAHDHVYQ